MREQRAQHTLIPRRASATTQQQSTPRRRDILPASRHQVGHFVGMHPEDQPYQTRQQRATYGNSFNAADAGEQDEEAFTHSTRMGTSARHLDIWHYGYPRTYQTDAVVGHGDSLAHPSHFIAINLDGHLEVIELSGGDPKR